ncbi:HIRAN domain-containing protein [Cystobacter fuscus]|uniref:HIRAN domain-containing protein n=1 Tax=Cystobacter fuscus TaxID=43 RepID=UPI002B2EAA5E|nr:DNA-binding protein [Cystobacter fuscus]
MIDQTPVIYLAWQDSLHSRRWFVVGRLRRLPDGLYEFIYTRGYEEARRSASMQPILGFMEPERRYLSDRLFPLFQNRLMSSNREEYAAYIERLGLRRDSESPPEPLQILARSGGRRATDSFEVFPAPLRHQSEAGDQNYLIKFFVHGVRYVPFESQVRVSKCQLDERLLLLSDWQNEFDSNSLMLRTEFDNYLLGWVPRYYCADISSLRDRKLPVNVRVERVNPVSSPTQQRLLCQLTAPWPEDFRALSSPEYEPLADTDYETSVSGPASM